ncbi:MAG: class II fructose-bisphosphate aldolase [Caldisericia bacterium]|nr:class II fructose-bisphosphate aldolase [Caldisericia bacterium]
MIVNLNDVLKKARTHKYAVGAFNVNSFVYADAFIRAAEEKNSPIILQFSPGVLKAYQDSCLVNAVTHIANMSPVPIVIHLDHGKSINDVKLALQYEYFTSYMIDGSSLSIDGNIEIVNNVRELLEKNYREELKVLDSDNIDKESLFSLEAELGHVGSEDDDKSIETSLENIEIFLESTEIDALAISIGNVHGQIRRETGLNFDLLKRINSKFFDVPFVLHGSSGVKSQDLKRAIKYGITKINVNTHFKKIVEDLAEESFEKYGKSCFSNYKIMQPLVFNKLKEYAMTMIDLFGSNNRVVPTKPLSEFYEDLEEPYSDSTYKNNTDEENFDDSDECITAEKFIEKY